MADAGAPRTLAQWYCLVVGATLLAVGLIGFLADSSFDTGSDVEGGSLLGFEVNGWHNLVHLASGTVLLAAANTRPTAKTFAIGFGFVYGIVALWGLIDGDQVLAVLPVNAADNVLHVLLSGLGIALGMSSPATKARQIRRHQRRTPPVRRDAAAGTEDAGRFTGGDEGIKSANEVTRTRS